jgi:phenylpyruvate tautomerase PptA (4-oxalocrotonate tautomerase family)
MPYARVEVPMGWPAGRKAALLDGIDAAFVATLGVPPADAFLRLFEYGRENARVPKKHGADFAFIEIQLFPGRDRATKAALYRALVIAFGQAGVPPVDLTIALVEIARADWGVDGGQAAG